MILRRNLQHCTLPPSSTAKHDRNSASWHRRIWCQVASPSIEFWPKAARPSPKRHQRQSWLRWVPLQLSDQFQSPASMQWQSFRPGARQASTAVPDHRRWLPHKAVWCPWHAVSRKHFVEGRWPLASKSRFHTHWQPYYKRPHWARVRSSASAQTWQGLAPTIECPEKLIVLLVLHCSKLCPAQLCFSALGRRDAMRPTSTFFDGDGQGLSWRIQTLSVCGTGLILSCHQKVLLSLTNFEHSLGEAHLWSGSFSARLNKDPRFRVLSQIRTRPAQTSASAHVPNFSLCLAQVWVEAVNCLDWVLEPLEHVS